MRSAQINGYGDTGVITINETSSPSVTPGKVLVEVKAAGLNPFDWKVIAGYMKDNIKLEFPKTIGMDFAGVSNGNEVFGQASFFDGSGAIAEFALAKEDSIALKPKNISFAEAAALPLAGVSAYQALTEHLKLQNDQKILIHGGAGGIGTFAIQMAKNIGAYVTTTSSSDDFDYVKDLGADEVIDYKNEKFEEKLKDYDAVYDTVGGETFTRSFKALKKGGVIVSMLEKQNPELEKTYEVTSISQFTQVNKARLTEVAKLVEEGAIKVHIDKSFPIAETANAFKHLSENHPRGKVVVTI
jgi:alcohol dehydrogenase